MNKPSIALITAVAARGTDEDQLPLESALRDAGAEVTIADWDQPNDWSRFDLALLRSTWDYTHRLDDFLRWVEITGSQTKLLNPPPVVKWNSDKHYLGELTARGVPTVLTRYIEPGGSAEAGIGELLRQPEVEEFVVKPAVGAGSQGARRFHRDELPAAAAHTSAMLNEGRSVLLQPYLDRIDEYGETALMFFDGEFSHAIRKAPILRKHEAPTGELFAQERITPRDADAAELRVAARVLEAQPFGTPLYARVDLIRDPHGEPVLLELELIEPSLFFPCSEGSAKRFATAVMRRARS